MPKGWSAIEGHYCKPTSEKSTHEGSLMAERVFDSLRVKERRERRVESEAAKRVDLVWRGPLPCAY